MSDDHHGSTDITCIFTFFFVALIVINSQLQLREQLLPYVFLFFFNIFLYVPPKQKQTESSRNDKRDKTKQKMFGELRRHGQQEQQKPTCVLLMPYVQPSDKNDM